MGGGDAAYEIILTSFTWRGQQGSTHGCEYSAEMEPVEFEVSKIGTQLKLPFSIRFNGGVKAGIYEDDLDKLNFEHGLLDLH